MAARDLGTNLGETKMTFRPGDPVWVDAYRPDYNLVGTMPATVISGPCVDSCMRPSHYIDLHNHPCPTSSDGRWIAANEIMRPRRDDDGTTGREVTGWGKCEWQPDRLTA